jgi:AcrR family transcriptional regulator
MTLYRHFASKNALIIAYLEQTNNSFWSWVEQAISEHPADPREQLVAIFEKLAELLTDPASCGCAFQHAAIEFPQIEHPIHQVAIQQRQSVHACFCTLAAQTAIQQPDLLADQLLLLVDGALMQARLRGPIDLALPLVQSAQALIDAQLTAQQAVQANT